MCKFCSARAQPFFYFFKIRLTIAAEDGPWTRPLIWVTPAWPQATVTIAIDLAAKPLSAVHCRGSGDGLFNSWSSPSSWQRLQCGSEIDESRVEVFPSSSSSPAATIPHAQVLSLRGRFRARNHPDARQRSPGGFSDRLWRRRSSTVIGVWM